MASTGCRALVELDRASFCELHSCLRNQEERVKTGTSRLLAVVAVAIHEDLHLARDFILETPTDATTSMLLLRTHPPDNFCFRIFWRTAPIMISVRFIETF